MPLRVLGSRPLAGCWLRRPLGTVTRHSYWDPWAPTLAICESEVFGSSPLAVHLIITSGEGQAGRHCLTGDQSHVTEAGHELIKTSSQLRPWSLPISFRQRGRAEAESLRTVQMLHLRSGERQASCEEVVFEPFLHVIVNEKGRPRWRVTSCTRLSVRGNSAGTGWYFSRGICNLQHPLRAPSLLQQRLGDIGGR